MNSPMADHVGFSTVKSMPSACTSIDPNHHPRSERNGQPAEPPRPGKPGAYPLVYSCAGDADRGAEHQEVVGTGEGEAPDGEVVIALDASYSVG